MTSRLPFPGQDDGTWGNVLNDFLTVAHNSDGTIKASAGFVQSVNGKTGSSITLAAADLALGNVDNTTDAAKPISTATQTALTAKVASGRLISSGTGLSGGGDLSADRSLAIVYGTTSGTAAQGNDTRITGAVQKGDLVFNVKDYGALGDGTTDDAPAVQAAITAAGAVKGSVYAPAGIYVIGTSLSISQPLSLVGAGQEATIFKAKTALNDYVLKFSGGTAGVGIFGAHFNDFSINANQANQTSGGGIYAAGAVQCAFERLHIYSIYNVGLNFQAITGGAFGHHNRVYGCLFDNSNSAGSGQGVNIQSCDENWFIACDFEFLGGSGSNSIALYDQAGLQHIISCNFVGGTNNCIGIRVQNAKDTRIIGCTFDGVSGDSVFIAGNKCIVSGNEFSSPGDQGNIAASGVHLEYNTHYNIISSNSLETSAIAGKTRSLIREESTGGSGSNLITGNSLSTNAAPTIALLESAGAGTILRNNIGWVTESTGTATVANGTTNIVVSHGLSITPTAQQITLTPTNNLGTAAKYWVSALTSTQFTINVDVSPGATTATFGWSAKN